MTLQRTDGDTWPGGVLYEASKSSCSTSLFDALTLDGPSMIKSWNLKVRLAKSLVHHGPAGAPAKATETKDAKETIFDETLKCAMCMDLCARPITVSTHAPPFR